MLSRHVYKKISALLVVAMILSIFSTSVLAAGETEAANEVTFSDIDQSYAKQEIQALADLGIISGYDGKFNPKGSLTRADLAVVLVKSLELEPDTASSEVFTDVPSDAWYAGYVGALVKSGITYGTSATTFSPNKFVSREELAVLFIRAFGWEETAKAAELDETLTDMDEVSDWAAAAVSFAFKIGFIQGVDNGDGTFSFNPDGNADRQALARLAYEFVVNRAVYEEAVANLDADNGESDAGSSTGGFIIIKDGDDEEDENTAAHEITEPGTYTLGNVTGDVHILAQDVTLKNTTITGNLLIAEEIADGDVILDQVTVTGTTTVEGGGPNSIHVANSILATVIVNKNDGSIRLVLEDGTNVQQITLQSGAIIETTNGVGQIGPVNLDNAIPRNSNITLNGSFTSIHVRAQQVAVNIGQGSTIAQLNVLAEALNSTFNLGHGSNIRRLIVDAMTSFAGNGTIANAEVNVDGVDFADLATRPVFAADPSVTDVVYSPEQVTLTAPDAGRQIILTGLKSSGTKDVTSLAQWSTSDASVAVVTSSGLVRAVNNGSTTVTADYGQFSVDVPVTVAVYQLETPTISAIEVTNGTIDVNFSGSVTDAIYSDFKVTATLNGQNIELSNLRYAGGQFTFDPVSLNDYYGSTLYITVESSANAANQFIGSQSDAIQLTGFGGTIVNVAGEPVPGLEIKFRKGLNATEGPIEATVTTDAYGEYMIYLKPGIYTGELGGEGTPYITSYLIGVSAVNVFNVGENQTAILVPDANETRIVLTWDRDPRDLDSHLIGPAREGGHFHTWFANKQYNSDGQLIVDLDLDDVTSYGPETTTVRQDVYGTYTFYVHHWAGESTLRASLAKIEVYRGAVDAPSAVYEVPTGTGSEIYWIVFEMTITEDGQVQFKAINELTNEDPADSTYVNEYDDDWSLAEGQESEEGQL
ncbi:S-layer homology domain-containing protein [Marinicrinis lubricantis]|uniref:S-layer homology domain-containing protein n=1 Tax=Marinicrinis lubricantis TaxID=2086470 RepID=A0ABW1IQD9_9BACL